MAGGNITIRVNDKGAKALLARIKAAMTPAAQKAVLMRVAFITLDRLKKQTPKRWTGQTRKAWTVIAYPNGSVACVNNSKVMGYLEDGTQAHGPKTARRLFIPLNRKTAQAGPQRVKEAVENYYVNLTASRSPRRGSKPPFILGVDYLLVRRVNGIRAMRIVRNQRILAVYTLRNAMRQFINSVLRG